MMMQRSEVTLARDIPMVPVPQHTSKTVLSSSSWAHSPTAEYSTSAAPVFTCFHSLREKLEITDIKSDWCVRGTWKKEWGDILNLRPRSSSWMQPRPATSSHGRSSMLGDVLKGSERATEWCISTLVNTAHLFLPLTLSDKVQRCHSAVFPLSFCEVLPHGVLQCIHFLFIKFLKQWTNIQI